MCTAKPLQVRMYYASPNHCTGRIKFTLQANAHADIVCTAKPVHSEDLVYITKPLSVRVYCAWGNHYIRRIKWSLQAITHADI